jgi:hypothetical protein
MMLLTPTRTLDIHDEGQFASVFISRLARQPCGLIIRFCRFALLHFTRLNQTPHFAPRLRMANNNNDTDSTINGRKDSVFFMSCPWLLRYMYALIASALLLVILAATSHSSTRSLIWRRSLHDPGHVMPLYQAPLTQCDTPRVKELRVIEGSYWVFLHQGYSLEAHMQTIEEEHAGSRPTIDHIFPETELHGLYYLAVGMDDVWLEAVRGDVGVSLVECDSLFEGNAYEGFVLEALWNPDQSTWEEVRQTEMATVPEWE